jgi:hypothetical protein
MANKYYIPVRQLSSDMMNDPHDRYGYLRMVIALAIAAGLLFFRSV